MNLSPSANPSRATFLRPLKRRPVQEDLLKRLQAAGLSSRLARLAAARGLEPAAVWPAQGELPSPGLLPDIIPAVERIVRAVRDSEIVVGAFDHDADGVSSGAVLWHALTEMGVPRERLHLVTSHKLLEGYGLSDKVVDRILALSPRPSLCITADQGSADAPRIARLAAEGIATIVTDHHGMPAEGPPAAAVAVVNPCREDSDFPDRAIAGVGVMWLVMSAVRAALVRAQLLPSDAPMLRHLLDLVAVGTVADAVSLGSPVNRWIVQRGLPLIEQATRPCWRVAPQVAEATAKGGMTARDIAFGLGPLLNAQGRMSDAREGILFLTAQDEREAGALLAQLQANNEARKVLERGLVAVAAELADAEVVGGAAGLTLMLVDGSPSVQGIVASRIVDRHHRPTICLSPSPTEPGIVSGSVRSVPGFDVRQALARIDAEAPGLLLGFGGHAAAAGLRLEAKRWTELSSRFAAVVAESSLDTRPAIEVDGRLTERPDWDLVEQLLSLEPFGRGFPAPVFEASVDVVRVEIYKEAHVCLTLRWPNDNAPMRAMWFNAASRWRAMSPTSTGDAACNLRAHLVFEISPSAFRGERRLELTVADVRAVLELQAREPAASDLQPRRRPMAVS